MIEKFGPFETYEEYNKERTLPQEVTIFKYGKEFFFTDKKEKLDPKNPLHQKVKPAKKLGDEFLIKTKKLT